MKRAKLREMRFSQGLCIYCGKIPHDAGLKSCNGCREKHHARQRKFVNNHDDHAAHQRDYREKIRIKALSGYGGVCSCCDEHRTDFLTLDHVKQDGNLHRQEVGQSSYQMYLWAVRENFPDTLRCMCMNCNISAYRNGGTCIHQLEKEHVIS